MFDTISLEIHLADHCNLRCANCSHFSQLAEPNFLNPIEYENNLKSINSNILNSIRYVKLLGGEPLLNKDIIKIIEISRNYFTNAIIEIVTNGILLKNMSDDFYNACINNDVNVGITKYPIKNIDYDKVLNDIKERYSNLKIYYFNVDLIFYKHKFDLNGKQDIDERHSNCFYFTIWDCSQLNGTKLYFCSYAANIKHFIKKFNYKFDEPEYLDLTTVNSFEEVIEWRNKRKDFCKYCKLYNFNNEIVPWQFYIKNKNDYE